MKKYTKWIVGVLCAVMLATSALAADTVAASTNATVTVQQVEPQWAVSLGGAGATVTSGDVETAFGLDLSVGRYGEILLPVEYGIRQSISFSDDDTILTTRVYNDWTLFTAKDLNLDLFAGGNVGLTYGNTKPVWTIAPEAGVRWWVKNDVAILARVEVPFDMVEWEYNDTVRYFLGFSVKF